MTRSKLTTLIGAAAGLAGFLGYALLPALVYGGYAGLILAAALFGKPVPAGFLPQSLVLGGAVLGVLLTAALFAAAGIALAKVVGWLATTAVDEPAKHEAPAKAK